MQKDKSSQGIVRDEKSQAQPKDQERTQTAHKSGPGHMPRQPAKEDDELQALREKSGFQDCGLDFDTAAKRMMISRHGSQEPGSTSLETLYCG